VRARIAHPYGVAEVRCGSRLCKNFFTQPGSKGEMRSCSSSSWTSFFKAFFDERIVGFGSHSSGLSEPPL